MKKVYITPHIACRAIDNESIMAASLNSTFPEGTPDTPSFGGDNDGSHTVNSKANVWGGDQAE